MSAGAATAANIRATARELLPAVIIERHDEGRPRLLGGLALEGNQVLIEVGSMGAKAVERPDHAKAEAALGICGTGKASKVADGGLDPCQPRYRATAPITAPGGGTTRRLR